MQKLKGTKKKLDLLKVLLFMESEVMPTAFGNAVKAFEIYSNQVYGAMDQQFGFG